MKDISEQTGQFFEGYAGQFDEIYDIQTRKGFLGWLNRRLRASILRRYQETFEALQPMQGCSVLDVGCGSGRYIARSLALGAARVTGIDLSSEMLGLAAGSVERLGGMTSRVNLICGDFLTYAFPERHDVAIVMGVMDYIRNPGEFLKKLGEDVARKAVLSFPVAESIWAPQRKVRYWLRNCPLYFYRKNQLERLMSASPFSSYAIKRINRDYFVVGAHETCGAESL